MKIVNLKTQAEGVQYTNQFTLLSDKGYVVPATVTREQLINGIQVRVSDTSASTVSLINNDGICIGTQSDIVLPESPKQTPEPTVSVTPTQTVTPTVTQTNTQTPGLTPSATPQSTATPTITPTVTPTNTTTPQVTASVTPSVTQTQTNTPTISFTPSATPPSTPASTPNSTPASTPPNTPTPTPTVTPQPSGFGLGFDEYVNSIIITSDNKILMGGMFTTYNGSSARGIIRLNSNGSRDNSFNIGTGFMFSSYGATINTVSETSDGKYIVSGAFNKYNGVSVLDGVIRLNYDGSIDSSFTYNNNINVQKHKKTSDGKYILSGYFTNYVKRLNSDGSNDASLSSSFNTWTYDSVPTSDGKCLVVGDYTNCNGVATNRIVRLNSNGSIDSNFTVGSGFSGSTYNKVHSAILTSTGKYLIGGEFLYYNGSYSQYLIRLNYNGTVDSTFTVGTGASNWIYSVYETSDGKYLIGGFFVTYGGLSYRGLVRLNSNGSVDTTFNIGTGFNFISGYINSICETSDGKYLIGGRYTQYNGVPAGNIVKLNQDGTIAT